MNKTVSEAQLIRSTQHAWRWFTLPKTVPPTTSSRLLRKQGYEPLDVERLMLAGCIAGQLGRLVRLEQSDGSLQLWGHAQDVAFALNCPVALGLTPPELVLELFNLGTLELNSRLVPPGLGSVGLLAEGDSWHALQLGDAARDDYQCLEQQIQPLWGFSNDLLKATLLWICRISGGYELQYHVWNEALAVDRGAWGTRWLSRLRRPDQMQQQRLLEQRLKALDEAHHYSQAQQAAVDEQAFASQLDLLRPMAQHLAAQYFRTVRPAQRTLTFGALLESAPPLPAAPEQTAVSTKTLTIPGVSIVWALLGALRGDLPFRSSGPEGNQATLDLSLSLPEQREGTLTLVLSPELVGGLGDHLATTWLVLLSLVTQTHPEDLTLPIGSTPDRNILKELLSQAQLTMTSYGYTAKQYLTLQRELRALAQIQVRLSIPFPHSARKAPVMSPLLNLTTEQRNPGAEPHITAIALGKWLHRVPDLMKQTMIVPASLLKLSPFAQRLGLVLIQALTTNPVGLDIEVGTLLKGAGIALSKHSPSETLDRIEEAFQQLAETGIIANCRYPSLVPGSAKVYCYQALGSEAEIRLRQRAIEGRWRGLIDERWHGWREAYETQHIHLALPTSVSSSTILVSKTPLDTRH